MALKGAAAKETVAKKILEIFDGSFQYEKEIRIPMLENGELVQIKCTLTCAKVNVGQNDDIAIPGANSNEINFETSKSAIETHIEATEEEKETVSRLAKMLDL